jgi:hypothetical protein
MFASGSSYASVKIVSIDRQSVIKSDNKAKYLWVIGYFVLGIGDHLGC